MPDDTKKPSTFWPTLAPLIGGAADVITTQRNLATGGNAREQNPMLPQNRVGNGLMLGGSYLANALLSRYLINHGHEKIGKMIGYGGAIDGGLSAAHNVGAFKWPGER